MKRTRPFDNDKIQQKLNSARGIAIRTLLNKDREFLKPYYRIPTHINALTLKRYTYTTVKVRRLMKTIPLSSVVSWLNIIFGSHRLFSAIGTPEKCEHVDEQ